MRIFAFTINNKEIIVLSAQNHGEAFSTLVQQELVKEKDTVTCISMEGNKNEYLRFTITTEVK